MKVGRVSVKTHFSTFSFGSTKQREGYFYVRKIPTFIRLSVFEGEGLCSIYHTEGSYYPELNTTEKIILT